MLSVLVRLLIPASLFVLLTAGIDIWTLETAFAPYQAGTQSGPETDAEWQRLSEIQALGGVYFIAVGVLVLAISFGLLIHGFRHRWFVLPILFVGWNIAAFVGVVTQLYGMTDSFTFDLIAGRTLGVLIVVSLMALILWRLLRGHERVGTPDLNDA